MLELLGDQCITHVDSAVSTQVFNNPTNTFRISYCRLAIAMRFPVMIRSLALALFLLLSCVMASTAQADLIVEFESASMQPGEVGAIDEFVRSSDGSDPFAQLNTFLRFRELVVRGSWSSHSRINSSTQKSQSPTMCFSTMCFLTIRSLLVQAGTMVYATS